VLLDPSITQRHDRKRLIRNQPAWLQEPDRRGERESRHMEDGQGLCALASSQLCVSSPAECPLSRADGGPGRAMTRSLRPMGWSVLPAMSARLLPSRSSMRVPIAGRISDSSGSGEAKLARRLAGASRGGTSGDPVGHVAPGELAGLGAQRPHVAAQPSVGRSPGAGLAHGLLAAVQEAFTIHQVAPVHTTRSWNSRWESLPGLSRAKTSAMHLHGTEV
jgi:hypothetical protein